MLIYVNFLFQLKVIDVEDLYLSNDYINRDACQVQLMKENKNHNRLKVNCEIIQDLPLDIKVSLKI